MEVPWWYIKGDQDNFSIPMDLWASLNVLDGSYVKDFNNQVFPCG